MSRQIQITNGAASAAFEILRDGNKSIEDIWDGGLFMRKLKPAIQARPLPNKDGDIHPQFGMTHQFVTRLDAWQNEQFTAFQVEECEFDVLKSAIRYLAKKEELRCNDFVHELIGLTEILKKAK